MEEAIYTKLLTPSPLSLKKCPKYWLNYLSQFRGALQITSKVSQLEEILNDFLVGCNRELTQYEVKQFLSFYGIVLKWNNHLHLTTLSTPISFAQRHICESLFAERHFLPSVRKVWDIGSGLGVPGIPISIIRPDLSVTLVEANKRKGIFLKEVKTFLKLSQISIINSRFESISGISPQSCVVIRALEQMNFLIPTLFKVGDKSDQFFFFGGAKTAVILHKYLPHQRKLNSFPIPFSNNRFLFSLERFT